MDVPSQLLIAGRYELHPEQLLGKGAFCRVHAGLPHSGLDRATSKKVAIKVMLNNHNGQLANEVTLLSRKLKGECEWYCRLSCNAVVWHLPGLRDRCDGTPGT